MSENINFIPANELPVAEGDEVFVLCVENGELKLKPVAKADDNSNYDIVIRVTYGYNTDEEDVYVENYEIVSGSYDALIQKIDASMQNLNPDMWPVALIIEDGIGWDNRVIKGIWADVVYWYKYSDEQAYFGFYGDDASFYLLEDNTIVNSI